jgi:hypothetical protein
MLERWISPKMAFVRCREVCSRVSGDDEVAMAEVSNVPAESDFQR